MGTGQPILYRMMAANREVMIWIYCNTNKQTKNPLWIKEGNNEQCFVLQLEGDHGDWGSHLLPLVRELARQVENFRGLQAGWAESGCPPSLAGLGDSVVNMGHSY